MSVNAAQVGGSSTDGTFDEAAIGIAHVGSDGRWIKVNDSLCEMLGYDRDELLALSFQDVTHPKDLESNRLWLEQLRRGEVDRLRAEKRYVRKDGSQLWVDLQVVPRRDADGRLLYYLSTILDISAAKRLERRMRQGRLQVVNFVNAIVHELRNPLNRVSLHAELARQSLRNGDAEAAEAALVSVVEGIGTTGEFLSYIQNLSLTGPADMPLDRVELTDVLEEVFADMRLLVAEHDCDMAIASDLPAVLGHRASLVHVIQNLVDNSIKYRRPDQACSIHVHCDGDDQEVALVVRDDGRGIPPEDLHAVLKPLRRGSNTEGILGHGLGLALCRQLVESMHGSIEIASSPAGTTVVLRLKPAPTQSPDA